MQTVRKAKVNIEKTVGITLGRAGWVFAVGVGVLGCISGCGRTNSFAVSSVDDLSTTSPVMLQSGEINEGQVRRHLNPYTYTGSVLISEPLYKTATTSTDDVQSRRCRNELLSAMMNAADANASEHLSRVLGFRVGFDITTGGLVIATASAAAITSGASAAALAITAAGLKGFEELSAEKVYQNQLVPAIIDSINAERVVQREKIFVGMTKPVSEYGVERGLVEAREYADMASFYRGLAFMSKNARDKAQEKTKPWEKRDAGDAETLAAVAMAKANLGESIAKLTKKMGEMVGDAAAASPTGGDINTFSLTSKRSAEINEVKKQIESLVELQKKLE